MNDPKKAIIPTDEYIQNCIFEVQKTLNTLKTMGDGEKCMIEYDPFGGRLHVCVYDPSKMPDYESPSKFVKSYRDNEVENTEDQFSPYATMDEMMREYSTPLMRVDSKMDLIPLNDCIKRIRDAVENTAISYDEITQAKTSDDAMYHYEESILYNARMLAELAPHRLSNKTLEDGITHVDIIKKHADDLHTALLILKSKQD